MSAQLYPIERINRLRARSRFWRQLAVAAFVFDIIWFLWLRPTFFPSPIAFNLLLIQIAFILAPALCLLSAIGISWERIIHSGVKPSTLGDRLAVIAFILGVLASALYSLEKLYMAVRTGQIPMKHSIIELTNSPILFIVFFALWLVCMCGSALPVWFALYFLRHGKMPPNLTLKRDALKRAP